MDISTLLLPIISLGAMGIIFGIGLGIASIKLRIEEDPNIALVREALPGANCGGCGYAGCDALANAIVNGTAFANACPVGGIKTTEKISEILGVPEVDAVQTSAFVKCNGCTGKSHTLYNYEGPSDCLSISNLPSGGGKSCSFGCLGGGDCVKVCNFGAIKIVDGIAVVDIIKCTSCRVCVETCPKKLIEIVQVDKRVRVVCNSKDTGPITKKACDIGCIGCKLCQNECKFDAIQVENNLAHVDYSKCVNCGACVKKCPTGAILNYKKQDKEPTA